MSLNAKMWIQVAGVLFFAAVAIAEATGLKGPTFGFPMSWILFALAAATMGFESWKTWRQMNTEMNEK